MSDNAINEPHRLYWVRAYMEARGWRKDLNKPGFEATRQALCKYIQTCRQNWASERRFENIHIAVNT